MEDGVDSCNMSEVDRHILHGAILGVDLTEVYSPVRVAAVASKFRLRGGTSFDLTNGWNLSDPKQRAAAWKRIRDEDPYCIIGSPPCTMFSALQELNKVHTKIMRNGCENTTNCSRKPLSISNFVARCIAINSDAGSIFYMNIHGVRKAGSLSVLRA